MKCLPTASTVFLIENIGILIVDNFMGNINFNISGTAFGTGSYNPVPTSFGPVSGSLVVYAIDANSPVTHELLHFPTATISWSNNNNLVAIGPQSTFIEFMNVGPIPGVTSGFAGLGIHNTLPDGTEIETVVTLVTTGAGTFTIFAQE